jgi:endonuclease-8
VPEGDTIHRLAAALRPGVVGEPITYLRLRAHGEVRRFVGQRVESVDALGKNLLVGVESGWVLHVHLGLRGRTRIVPAEGPQARAPTSFSIGTPVVLATPRVTFAVTKAMRADMVRRGDLGLEARLRRVGPDLLDPSTDLEVVVTRASAPVHAAREIATVLLDQRIASGLGNVYKSELLFLAGVHPRATMADLPREVVRSIYEDGARLLRSNLGAGRRATVGELRGVQRRPETALLWVYERAGLPCLRCGATIERALQGDEARSTYWCPRCQPSPTTPVR